MLLHLGSISKFDGSRSDEGDVGVKGKFLLVMIGFGDAAS